MQLKSLPNSRHFQNFSSVHSQVTRITPPTKPFLIGISPSGVVTFVSKLYPGSTSDKELTRQSGLLEYGDSIMDDRGFDILQDLEE